MIALGAVDAGDQPGGLPADAGLVWAVCDSSGRGIPDVYLTTSAESDGEIEAKRVDSDGNVVGADETFVVLPEPT